MFYVRHTFYQINHLDLDLLKQIYGRGGGLQPALTTREFTAEGVGESHLWPLESEFTAEAVGYSHLWPAVSEFTAEAVGYSHLWLPVSEFMAEAVGYSHLWPPVSEFTAGAVVKATTDHP